MAPEEPFDSERPPDEAWWTRELHRNEKLMDKYMAVLGDNPDWEKFQRVLEADDVEGECPDLSAVSEAEEEAAFEEYLKEAAAAEAAAAEGNDTDEPDPDDDLEVNADYPAASQLAREFACAVFNLDSPPCNAELLFLSAGKVGANLAGGHGLGYDDDTICGNIVKCRWALSDCEFCREMLEQLHEKTGEEDYARLAEQSRRISDVIRERIARLRKRVWW
jgi:hypothetical protein